MFISRFYARYLPALMLILVLVASAFAFAATNAVPESGAGDGDGDISGYDITNIDYTLAADPAYLDSVEFDIASTTGNVNDPDVVKIQIPRSAPPSLPGRDLRPRLFIEDFRNE